MTNIGIAIVTYNSADVIEACLESCSGFPCVVVDNASTDETLRLARERPEVFVIANPHNRGFAAAANQGAAALRTDWVLLLNPDVRLLSSPRVLANGCERTGAMLAGGRLMDERGHHQTGFAIRSFPDGRTLAAEVLGVNRLLPWNLLNRRYRCLDRDPFEAGPVDQPPGAMLLFHLEVWRHIGGFDESFWPVWFEDVDFCKRAKNSGYGIYYLPDMVAAHRGAQSVGSIDWEYRQQYWYASLLRYASKHLRPGSFRGVAIAVLLASVARAFVSLFERRSLKPIAVYASVFGSAASCLISGRGASPCIRGLSKAAG